MELFVRNVLANFTRPAGAVPPPARFGGAAGASAANFTPCGVDYESAADQRAREASFWAVRSVQTPAFVRSSPHVQVCAAPRRAPGPMHNPARTEDPGHGHVQLQACK